MDRKILQPLEELFKELAGDWIEERYPDAVRPRSAAMVFPDAVTAWLMISQKTIKSDTLSGAVLNLRSLNAESGVGQWLLKSKRYRLGQFSHNPGGFSQARARLPLEMVEALVEELTNRAEQEHLQNSKLYGRRVYVLDGTLLNLQTSEAIRDAFPPTSNHHGTQRPVARVVVAHNVVTAVALAPEIGSIKEAEQALCSRLLERICRGSVVIGDSNFGVFSVAWEAKRHQVISLVRLQRQRACRILNKKEITEDGDYPVRWSPSKSECKKHGFPHGTYVDGRLVAVTPTVPGCKCERLFLFTTWSELAAEQLAEVYRRRWLIEQDLRTIKQTVDLETISSKDPQTVKKEILLGVAAYSLIRALIARGCKAINLMPRELGFSRALLAIETSLSLFAKTSCEEERAHEYQFFLRGLRAAKLPRRSKPRVEPRALAGTMRQKFPALRESRQSARLKIIANLGS